MRNLEPLLDRLLEEIPAAATQLGYGRTTCILHTRAACDTLRALGIRVRPLTCRLAVYNAAYAARCNREQRMVPGHELANGEHSLGIGFGRGDGDGGYDGHVIAVVDERYALDLTLDQASRPAKNIRLEPSYFDATPAFLAGEEPYAGEVNGCFVQYVAVPNDRGFLRVPDWTMPPTVPHLDPARRVIRTLAA